MNLIWNSLRLVVGILVIITNLQWQVDCSVLPKGNDKEDEGRQGRSFFGPSPPGGPGMMYPRPGGYPPPGGGPPPGMMMGPPPPPMNPYYQEGYAEGSFFSGIKSFFLGILTQWFISSAVEQTSMGGMGGRPGMFGGGPPPPPPDGMMPDYGGIGMPDEPPGYFDRMRPPRPPQSTGIFGF